MGRYRTRGKDHNKNSCTQSVLDQKREKELYEENLKTMSKDALMRVTGHTGKLYTEQELQALIRKIRVMDITQAESQGPPTIRVKADIPWDIENGRFGRWRGNFVFIFKE